MRLLGDRSRRMCRWWIGWRRRLRRRSRWKITATRANTRLSFSASFWLTRWGRRISKLSRFCAVLGREFVYRRAPETNERVWRFYDALGELGDERRDDLVWILGIDMAHIGRRYGTRCRHGPSRVGSWKCASATKSGLHVCARPTEKAFRIGAPGAGRIALVRVFAALHVPKLRRANRGSSARVRAVEYRRGIGRHVRGY